MNEYIHIKVKDCLSSLVDMLKAREYIEMEKPETWFGEERDRR